MTVVSVTVISRLHLSKKIIYCSIISGTCTTVSSFFLIYDFYSWQSLPSHSCIGMTQVKPPRYSNLGPQHMRWMTYQLKYPSLLKISILSTFSVLSNTFDLKLFPIFSNSVYMPVSYYYNYNYNIFSLS